MLAVVAIVSVAAPASRAAGTTAKCSSPPTKDVRWAWPKGSRVRVNISPAISPLTGARQAVESAFRNWQKSSGAAGTGWEVTFEITFSEIPLTGPGTFQVDYGTVESVGQAETLLQGKRTGLVSARCVVDSRVTDPIAIANAMAHEIGHTFGLGECDECSAGSSVMTRFNGNYNDTTSGRNGPSNCDDAAVRDLGARGDRP